MQQDDLSKSLVAFEQHSTLVAVIELSAASWLVAGVVPGLERQPLKKLGTDAQALLTLLHRWRDEAEKAVRPSSGWCWLTKPAAMASGLRAGCASAGSKPM
jgi:transposase